MFTCTCSFKREEASSVSYQDGGVDLKRRYESVLRGKERNPMLHANAPSHDSEWFRHVYLPQNPGHFNPVAGLHLRKVDMGRYNEGKDAIDRRQLTFYTLRGALPDPTVLDSSGGNGGPGCMAREANLHACAHLYASDRNSLFIIPNHLDRGRDFTRMASLSHSVVFHVGIEDLVMPPEPRDDHPCADPTDFEDEGSALCNGEDREGMEKSDKDEGGRKWYVQESWVTRAGGGRGLHMSRLWDYEKGIHIASTMQDGLVRFKSDTRL